MHRFYVPLLVGVGERAELPEEAARQCFRVLKLRPGERIALFDGSGRETVARLEQVTAGSVGGPVESLETPDRELSFPLELLVGLPRAEKWEWILQKGTELGVTRFTALETARCVARVERSEWDRKAVRWRKILQEAAEQSGRTRLPEMAPPTALKSLVHHSGSGIVLYPSPALPPLGAVVRRQALDPGFRLLIGPEGGLEEREFEMLNTAGWLGASLGHRILRCETAALAAAAILVAVRE